MPKTGVIYVTTSAPDFISVLDMIEAPLATLPESRVRPSRAAFEEIMEEWR